MGTLRVVVVRGIVVLALGLIGVGTLPTFAQDGTPTAGLVWSADALVVELSNVSIGAHGPEAFSNVGGSSGLQAKWLWYYIPGRQLYLAFTENVPGAESLTLQIDGDLSIPFHPGITTYTWNDVDIDWADGQIIAVRIVRTMSGTPATGAPTISGTAQVGETLTVDTSGITDADGLTNAAFAYQWSTNGMSSYADIAGATSTTYTVAASDVGKTIKAMVTFTDDEGNEESLISAPTATVVRAPNIPPTGALTISGTAQVGETLTADTSGIADANGLTNPNFSYKWIANDGNTDAEIENATSTTYSVAASDVGKTIKVRVTFTDDGGNEESLISEPTATVVRAPNIPPTGALTISGTAQVGETLTADTSGIADANGLTNPNFSYKWIANDGNTDAEIENATSTTYSVAASDVGKTIKVKVSFTDDGGNEETLTSEPTAEVARRPNSPARGAPSIVGVAQVGETLTADTSSIADPDGLGNATFSYQWIANDGNTDAEIENATDSTYEASEDDLGKTIKVKVSFTDDGGNEETLTSEPTREVTSGAGPLTGFTVVDASGQTQSMLGTLADGGVLTLDDPDNGSYGIRVDTESGVEIGSVRLQLTGGKSVDRTEGVPPYSLYGDDGEGALHGESLPAGNYTLTATAYSEADLSGDILGTLAISFTVESRLNNPARGAPSIVGIAQVGETLTADTSSISDPDGLGNATFSYQWISHDGTTDTDIQDATNSTYTLSEDDLGKTIKLKVSFTDDGGNEETLTSEPTAAVAVAGGIPTAPPRELQVKTGASQELVISWKAPSGGPLATGFKVQWKSGTEDFDGSASSTRQTVLSDADTLTYTVTGLTNGTEHTVRVIAYNTSGDGPPSAEEIGIPEAPNVIVIFLDDVGYADIGFSASSLGLTPDVATPNLDRLAEEGVTFSNGYVTFPVCSPSRSGLLTGRYPARFGMEANVAFNPFDTSLGLTTDETLFPTYLESAGYFTGVVGKWHLGTAKKFTPLQRGFDYFYGFLGGSHDYFLVDASDPGNKKFQPLVENTSPASFTGYLTDALTDKAIDFVTKDRGQPFFLYLPYSAPHSPYQATQALEDEITGSYTHRYRRTYLAMVRSVDQNVGRLLTALEGAGKRENTIIFFLSDHGGIGGGPMNNGTLREGKGTLYEGGLRVPFVASWPSRWPQNQTYEPMVISLDIAATVLDLANATVADTTRPIDGVNLDPYLRGEQLGPPHEALFWRKADIGNKVQAIRFGDVKLVQTGSATPELFNLATDIGEEDDLFAEERETARTLAALWNTWNEGNKKASHIWGIFNYEDAFEEWLNDHKQERLDWVAQQTRHRITIR